MRFQRFLIAVCVAAMALFSTAPTIADEKDIIFEADTVSVNQDDGSMLAVGNVQMKQVGMTLTADEVRYNRDADRAVANGNVTFIDATGTVHQRRPITSVDERTPARPGLEPPRERAHGVA